MKSLNSRNKRIKYFHEVTGFPFSTCRRNLKENNWDLDNSGIGLCVDNMPGEYGLYRFADDVITELKKYIDENYHITWSDIHFEYDHEVLVLTVIDSDGIAYEGDINTNYKDTHTNYKEYIKRYRNYCIKAFVDQIISAYYFDEEADYIARGPWNYKIIHSLMNKTAAENISCYNQEDYCKWFKGTILFSFPEIPCSFQLDVLDDRVIYSRFDFIFIVDYLYRNAINSGLVHAVHSGEIFDLSIGANRQEITYIKDNDEELLYWINGDWYKNLPELFSAINNML